MCVPYYGNITLICFWYVLQVADRLETAVNKSLDDGWRTGDLWKEGFNKVKCSEMGDILVNLL